MSRREVRLLSGLNLLGLPSSSGERCALENNHAIARSSARGVWWQSGHGRNGPALMPPQRWQAALTLQRIRRGGRSAHSLGEWG